MPTTSLALSSVLGDSDISENIVISEVIDMAYTREKYVFMDSTFWDGMTNPARREQNLAVDHSSPILPYGNAGWYFANVGALTHHVDDGLGIRDQEAVSLRNEILTNPAQIIGLAECDRELEMALEVAVAGKELTGKPLLEPAVADSASAVSSFAHSVWRGKEPLPVLLGVRALTGKQLIF